jgi:hypothetical protein
MLHGCVSSTIAARTGVGGYSFEIKEEGYVVIGFDGGSKPLGVFAFDNGVGAVSYELVPASDTHGKQDRALVFRESGEMKADAVKVHELDIEAPGVGYVLIGELF